MLKPWWIGTLAAVLAGAGLVSAGETRVQVLVGQPAAAKPAEGPADVLKEMGDYWIGLECSQVSGALRVQLDVPEKQGLLVENVVPDSPAAKAGIERFDVLLKANDQPLEKVLDLIQVINKAKDGKVSVELIHAGKKKTVAATPAKRPPEARLWDRPIGPGLQPDVERIEKWMKEMLPGGDEGKPLRFHYFHPGQILPPGALVPPGVQGNISVTVSETASLADGYKVTITREGDKPAKITVTKDKETWEATEGDLGKLPEAVRPQVQQFMHRPRTGMNMFWGPAPGGAARVEAWPIRPGEGLQGAIDARIERRLDQMNRKIEELRKSMDEIRSHRSPKNASPEKQEPKQEKTPEKTPEKPGDHT